MEKDTGGEIENPRQKGKIMGNSVDNPFILHCLYFTCDQSETTFCSHRPLQPRWWRQMWASSQPRAMRAQRSNCVLWEKHRSQRNNTTNKGRLRSSSLLSKTMTLRSAMDQKSAGRNEWHQRRLKGEKERERKRAQRQKQKRKWWAKDPICDTTHVEEARLGNEQVLKGGERAEAWAGLDWLVIQGRKYSCTSPTQEMLMKREQIREQSTNTMKILKAKNCRNIRSQTRRIA